MPGFIAKHICPELIIVPPDFTKYQEASVETKEVFVEFDINFSSTGLDEASLNLTKYCQKHNMTSSEVNSLN